MGTDGPESLASLTAVNGVKGFNELRIFRLLRRFRSAMGNNGRRMPGNSQVNSSRKRVFRLVSLSLNSHIESQTSSKRGQSSAEAKKDVGTNVDDDVYVDVDLKEM